MNILKIIINSKLLHKKVSKLIGIPAPYFRISPESDRISPKPGRIWKRFSELNLIFEIPQTFN